MKTNINVNLLATGIGLVAVAASFGQPVITNQPQAQAVSPGRTATFTLGAAGTEPLAYQWQRNLGAGFYDLAGCTNTLLSLTNLQPWDAADYRVAVTNLSGSRISTVAHLYVTLPELLTNRVVIDNFDDNKLTGWSSEGHPASVVETNQQLTIGGYWPGVITWEMTDSFAPAYVRRNWSLANGQTLEWRADLVQMSEHATAVAVEVINSASDGGYALIKGRDFIKINKPI